MKRSNPTSEEFVSIEDVRALIPQDLQGKIEINWCNKNFIGKRSRITNHMKNRTASNTTFDGGVEVVFKENIGLNVDIVNELIAKLTDAGWIIQAVDLGSQSADERIIGFLDQRCAIENFKFIYHSGIDDALQSFSRTNAASMAELEVYQDQLDPGFAMVNNDRSGLMEFVTRCSNLKKLTIHDCKYEDGENSPDLDCGIFTYLPQLAELHLPDYNYLSSQNIRDMTTNLNHNLKAITLFSGLEMYDYQVLEPFFERYHNLEKVSLRNFLDAEESTPVLGKSLQIIVKNNPDLTHLDIEGSELSDDDLVALLGELAINCQNLQSLNIQGCRSTEQDNLPADFDSRIHSGVVRLLRECSLLTKVILPNGRVLEDLNAITGFAQKPPISFHSSSTESLGSQSETEEEIVR
ncbi:MAG: hypothetical protein V4612_00005 [Pseudomonadota bacterium]